MGGRVLLGGAIATFLVVGVLAPSTPVNAQSEEERIEDIADDLRDLERQIEDAGNERSEIAAQILEVQGRMAAMLEILVEAERALREIEVAIGGKEAEIAELQRKARILETQIADTRLNQQLTHIQIRDRAVELYMNGSGGLGNLAFGVDDVQSASVSVEYAGNIVANTGVLLRSLEVLENQEHTQQAILDEDQARQGEVLASLEIDRVEADAHRATVDASRAEIQIELNAVESLLAEVNAQIDDFESHIGALERESRELENEIARRQIREGTAPGAFGVPCSRGSIVPLRLASASDLRYEETPCRHRHGRLIRTINPRRGQRNRDHGDDMG